MGVSAAAATSSRGGGGTWGAAGCVAVARLLARYPLALRPITCIMSNGYLLRHE